MSDSEPRCKYCGAYEAGIERRLEWSCPNAASSGRHKFEGRPEAEAEPEPEAEPAPYQQPPIEWWIERVDRAVQESAQLGSEPMLSKAAVMAQLYGLQLMERQAVALEKIGAALERKEQYEIDCARAEIERSRQR